MNTPLLMLGAGRMGGAILDGWRAAEAVAPDQLMIRDPHPGPAALDAARLGARLNPPDAELAEAATVLLCVKPQLWREAAQAVTPWLRPDAIVVSVAAGVGLVDLTRTFGGRRVARVMPTTAAAIGQGVASLHAADPDALATARALFAPLGVVVELEDEALMHAATAVSGSAPAYLYALVESLEAAGVNAGLAPHDAQRLARATIAGSAALMARSGDEPADLRRQVTSPGGTTEAALNILLGERGLPHLMRDAVAAAVRRSRALGG